MNLSLRTDFLSFDRQGNEVEIVYVCLTLPHSPADAVLDAGLSKHVFVERGNGIFEPRQVDTGERFQDRVQILTGSAEGEKVVASGTFLVDSESRLEFSPEESASRR